MPIKQASGEVKVKVLCLEFREGAWADNVNLGVICIIKKIFKVMRINRKGWRKGKDERRNRPTEINWPVVVHCLSHVQLFVTPSDCSTPGFPVLHCTRSLLKLRSIESVMPSNHLIFCRLLLLLSIFPSIRVFFNELALRIRWPKYWSFSISPFNEYLGLISFRIDWFDLLAVQGTLKSLL